MLWRTTTVTLSWALVHMAPTAAQQDAVNFRVAGWNMEAGESSGSLLRSQLTARQGVHLWGLGEVRNGKVKLEEAVLPCGVASGLEPLLVVINAQQFTKTANCWGVRNNAKGTNTNRSVVFRKG